MSGSALCRAVKRDGKRCTNAALIAGFCRTHYPKAKSSSHERLREGAKTAGEIIAVAGGAVQLIEVIVQLWKTFPFGPAPKMPNDYHYLAERVGTMWPELPDEYIPFMAGPDSVDWRKARTIYDQSAGILQARTTEDVSLDTKVATAENLEALIVSLLDDMAPTLREMVLRKLGSLSESDDAC